MLRQISIEGLGLIEAAEVELGSGLQVITGETGVGKSMLLGALAALRGERVRADQVREGADRARIRGFFSLAECPGSEDRDPAGETRDRERLQAVEAILGERIPDGELLVERHVLRSGRHRARVNGVDIPVSMLRGIGDLLLDIQGQRSQLSLLEPDNQRLCLDGFSGHLDAVERFAELHTEAKRLAAKIDAISREDQSRTDRRIVLRHVSAELGEARLQVGERDRVLQELELLESRDELFEAIDEIVSGFYENEGAVLDRMARSQESLADHAPFHEGLREFDESFDTARAAVEEGVAALRRVRDDLDQDPRRLAELQARRELLMRLEDRYHRQGDDLVAYAEEVQAELESLEEGEGELPALREELDQRLEDLGSRARELGKRRRTCARRLAREVTRELADVGMEQAHVKVEVSKIPATSGWHGLDSRGGDTVEFEIAPNPGHPPRPLRNIASGGELSRVMLSLRRVLASIDHVPILIFDEIDAGVGARLGAELGKKLRQIGESHQVICVSHLPQIASCAHGHFRVGKDVEGNSTRTFIESLDSSQRIEEIASMIRGKGKTRTSLAEAEEMLQEGVRSSGNRSASDLGVKKSP